MQKVIPISITLILILSLFSHVFPVLGDCFGCGENVPPATLAGRTPVVAVKFYPDSVMPAAVHYLGVRFYDANKNETFSNVAFLLTIAKQNHFLFKDIFYAHTGVLAMKVISTNDSKSAIIAQQDPVWGGWLPQEEGQPITMYASLFNDTNTTYHMSVQMVTVDYANSIFESPNIPTFNFTLDTKEQNQTMTIPNMMSKHFIYQSGLLLALGPSIPEFPFAILVLMISISSLIIFYRIVIRN